MWKEICCKQTLPFGEFIWNHRRGVCELMWNDRTTKNQKWTTLSPKKSIHSRRSAGRSGDRLRVNSAGGRCRKESNFDPCDLSSYLFYKRESQRNFGNWICEFRIWNLWVKFKGQGQSMVIGRSTICRNMKFPLNFHNLLDDHSISMSNYFTESEKKF